jgi:TrbL/VirB6 plasmid conjugal transfer protein
MQDYFSFVFGAINNLLNQDAGLFESMGMNLFRGFALIVISWFGLQSALHSASGGGGFNWAKFAGLVQELLLCYVMLSFYTVPIPGLGISFTHLILDQVQSMVATLNQTSVQGLLESLNGLESNLPPPSPLAILEIVRFFVLVICIAAAQAVTLYVVMYGYVATAVIMLLGPVFIPFKILPQMEWMFWGWFRAFLQYAFYQLVASAYVFVFGQFLMRILGMEAAGPLSSTDMAVLFLPLLLTLVTFVLGTIKVPALTHAIFAGRAGDYVALRWR